MSIRLTSQEHKVALFDSLTDFAFGPIFDTEKEAEDFLWFCRDVAGLDPRYVTPGRLEQLGIKYREAHNQT